MSDNSAAKRADQGILILGGGAIGVCFATVFGDHGFSVTLIEPDRARRDGVLADVGRRHATVRDAGLAIARPNDVIGRLRVADRVDGAIAEAVLIIEAGPENLDIKRAIVTNLLAHARPDAVIATASSAITISDIVTTPSQRARCLVAHPVNPPTLIRVVELVPAPETSEATVDVATGLFSAAGFDPITLGAELPGFVFNRLQSAVLREAYRLVGEGVVDVDGVDRLVRDGLGPRWALSGPFETAELNTPGGIAAHAARMGPAYRAIGEARGERDCDWTPDLVAEIERQRRALVPADALPGRRAWRDRALAGLIAARARIFCNDR